MRITKYFQSTVKPRLHNENPSSIEVESDIWDEGTGCRNTNIDSNIQNTTPHHTCISSIVVDTIQGASGVESPKDLQVEQKTRVVGGQVDRGGAENPEQTKQMSAAVPHLDKGEQVPPDRPSHRQVPEHPDERDGEGLGQHRGDQLDPGGEP